MSCLLLPGADGPDSENKWTIMLFCSQSRFQINADHHHPQYMFRVPMAIHHGRHVAAVCTHIQKSSFVAVLLQTLTSRRCLGWNLKSIFPSCPPKFAQSFQSSRSVSSMSAACHRPHRHRHSHCPWSHNPGMSR